MVVKVKLLLFAQAKDLAGISVDFLQLPPLILCKNLLDIIVKQYSLEAIQHNILLSLNEHLCELEEDLELKEGDELAVIPPLSGG